MKEECQKYGSVVSLLIPKENPGKGQVGLCDRKLSTKFSLGPISVFQLLSKNN